MAVSARLIRRRLKSVGNTKKITKAMELVSAAKMRRAVGQATAARRFSALSDELLRSLSALGAHASHPLMRANGADRSLCLVISSDRGLCGAYNAQLMRTAESAGAELGGEVDYIAIGKVGEQALRRSGRKVIASFAGLTNAPSAHAVRPAVSLARSEFLSGIYGRVFIAFTEYRSALRQVPQVKSLLPLVAAESPSPYPLPDKRGEGDEKERGDSSLIVEPDAETVLEFALPRFLESSVYQAVLEAAASEHSSRMMSMRSATDAAAEMMDDLTFTLNQARQSAITSEIAEISAGRAALEG